MAKMKLLLILCVALLTGCASFNFRPFGVVVCTSACDFVLHAPAKAASAP